MKKIVFHDGETVESLLSRAAYIYGARSAREFRFHLGIANGTNLTSSGHDRLSQVTGADLGEIRRRAMTRKIPYALVGGQKLYVQDVWVKSARYCPHCLASDLRDGPLHSAYVRSSWLCVHSTTCVHHGVRLVTAPTSYGRELANDFIRYLAQRPKEVAGSLRNAERCTPTPIDYFIERAFSGECIEEVDDLLEGTPLFLRLKMFEVVGALEVNGFTLRHVLPSSIENARDCLNHGYWIMSDTGRFAEFLGRMTDRYHALRKFPGKWNPFGGVSDLCSKHDEFPSIRRLLDHLREFAMDRLPIGPEDNSFLGPGGVRRWHTLKSAADYSGLTPDVMRTILIDRGLTPNPRKVPGAHKVMVSCADMDSLQADIASMVEKTEVAKILGTSFGAVERFHQHGLITPVFGKNYGLRYYSRAHCHSLLKQLQRIAVFPAEWDGWLTFDAVANTFRLDMAEAVKLGVRRKIALALPETWRPEDGISGLRMSKQDLERRHAKSWSTRKDVAGLLHCRVELVEYLIERGHLEKKTMKCPRNGINVTAAISNKSVSKFRKKFISQGELSVRVESLQLVRWTLNHYGVQPAIPSQPPFYRRREAEAALLLV